ncbi:MAG: signal peptidase I [Nocardioidaceae bacterium]|nr:signal peptidase I [Nocardioidaceae bacterium]MCL2612212.1 signal peptidase I [Nocardioidaceae bacterium]
MKVLGWLGQVMSWLVILCVALVLAVAVIVPRLAGATPYTVLTGSMRPHYPPGTLVVVKPVDADTLSVGQVATYQIQSGEPAVATHRIVAIGTTLTGQHVFTFKGDANPSPDPAPVQPAQIRGQLWYAVPYLGYANNVLTGHQRQVAVVIVAGLLIGYAVLMFAGALRDRRRRRRPGSGGDPERLPARPAHVAAVPETTPLLVMGGGVVTFLLASGLIGLVHRRSVARLHG